MHDFDACDGVDTTTSPTTITATRMGRSVGLNTAAAEFPRFESPAKSKNFKSANCGRFSTTKSLTHDSRRTRSIGSQFTCAATLRQDELMRIRFYFERMNPASALF